MAICKTHIPDEIWLSLLCHADKDKRRMIPVCAANAKAVDREIRVDLLVERMRLWHIAQNELL